MRLIVARCEVRYCGRLNALLPEALRLIIVKADGSPGPNFAKAHQYQITSAPNGGKYFISADRSQKTLYIQIGRAHV